MHTFYWDKFLRKRKEIIINGKPRWKDENLYLYLGLCPKCFSSTRGLPSKVYEKVFNGFFLDVPTRNQEGISLYWPVEFTMKKTCCLCMIFFKGGKKVLSYCESNNKGFRFLYIKQPFKVICFISLKEYELNFSWN